jgi:hypothetical protein
MSEAPPKIPIPHHTPLELQNVIGDLGLQDNFIRDFEGAVISVNSNTPLGKLTFHQHALEGKQNALRGPLVVGEVDFCPWFLLRVCGSRVANLRDEQITLGKRSALGTNETFAVAFGVDVGELQDKICNA